VTGGESRAELSRHNWITPDFQLKSAVLAFEEVDGTHSGENQAEVIFKMLEHLCCLDKLLAITGDNADNNDTFSGTPL
jgi:hypothetical protein